jgi:hypothetical protein
MSLIPRYATCVLNILRCGEQRNSLHAIDMHYGACSMIRFTALGLFYLICSGLIVLTRSLYIVHKINPYMADCVRMFQL